MFSGLSNTARAEEPKARSLDDLLRIAKGKGMVVTKGSKNIVFTLDHFGIPAGNKKENNVSIPFWILNSKEYTTACVRGLIDKDD